MTNHHCTYYITQPKSISVRKPRAFVRGNTRSKRATGAQSYPESYHQRDKCVADKIRVSTVLVLRANGIRKTLRHNDGLCMEGHARALKTTSVTWAVRGLTCDLYVRVLAAMSKVQDMPPTQTKIREAYCNKIMVISH